MDWSLWDVIWTTFVVFLWISVLIIFFHVIFDVFRSRDLSGWGKTGWIVLLIILPLIGLLIYIIARGPGMAQRAHDAQLAQAEQIMAASGADPAGSIAQAKSLLDSGAIDQSEFDTLKRRALGG